MSAIVPKVNLNPKGLFTPINIPDCYTKIAELAFYKAGNRGFESVYEFDDWIEAEREFKEIVKNNHH